MITKNTAPPTIFWDFEGTLVRCPGWGMTMLQSLDDNLPGHGINHEQIRAFLHQGFPWHNPERYHPELCHPAGWWAFVEAVLARAYQGVGIGSSDSKQLAQYAHELMLKTEEYRPFEDTLPALQQLSDRDWRHIILSNNFPELPHLLESLPIKDFIHQCLSSGITGYEKPNPEAFALAMESAGHPEKVWMVGDNLNADVRGAEAAGIPAILVRKSPPEPVNHFAIDLLEAAAIIEDFL